MKNDKIQNKPACFGELNKVFPMTEIGLRQTPDDCMYLCLHKTLCLKNALASINGKVVKQELIKKNEESGTINFFERWARKKQIHKKH
ncbi:MAG: hypothetical protein B6I26_07150 [Desulfobacteraceae bacterium 4572_130]|nr:MAG: hypothetical protein B6I26_07150 [Desulfobacteraceae bacterium 4572_130]